MGKMLAALALASTVGLSYRAASFDISPPDLLPLGGYTARKGKKADEGGTPLYARVLMLGDTTFVTLDALTIPEGFAEELRIRTQTSDLWVIATHTHCAPDSQMLNPKMTMAVPGIASYSPFWFNWYADKVAEAIDKTKSVAATPVRKLTLSTAHLKLNRGRRPGARPDRMGWLLMADDKPLLASYSAHATFHDENWNKTDGDWPGALADRLDSIVVPGAIGDVSPVCNGRTGVEKCRNFVDNFCQSLLDARVMGVWPERDSWGSMQARCPLDPPTPHPTFASSNKIPDALAQILVTRFAQESCSVQIAAFGKFLMVGVPGEPTAALGRRIQQEASRLGFPHCLVVSHVNGWIGYILEPLDYDRGGYEATLSFNGDRTAQRIVEAVSTQIKSLQDRLRGRGSATAGNSSQKAAA